MSIDVDARQLEIALNGLEKKIARKVVAGALRDATKLMLGPARAATPVAKEPTRIGPGKFRMPGALRKSVKVRRLAKNRKGTYAIALTTSASGNMFQGATYYGGFVHWGHKVGRRKGAVTMGKRDGKRVVIADTRTTSVPAQPFLRDTFDKYQSQVVNKATSAIAEGIVREAKVK